MQLGNFVYFYPEKWGQVERFAYLYRSTYEFPNHVQSCVQGTSSHFRRALTLKRLAESMVGGMKEDRAELDAKGHSRNLRSSEVTAVVEASIMSLYSSIDTARKIITHIYSRFRGLPNSTRKTFQGAVEGTIDERVPEPIRLAFRDATWYQPFRKLRDALTHIGTGSCHLDTNTSQVLYLHDSLRHDSDPNRAMVIPDIFAELDAYFAAVNRFLGQIFHALNQTLKDNEVWQMCGLFGGRCYSRFVRPSEAVNGNAGRCDAYTWFDLPGNPKCPFAETCGAYKRRFDQHASNH